MRRSLPSLLGLCVLALGGGNAWAGTQGGSDAASASTTTAALAHTRQELAQHRAELERLQQEVARQESQGKQADARQQQQDRTIAELRQQLQALQGEPDQPTQRH